MGEAKRRGTFEQRAIEAAAKADERRQADLARRQAAWLALPEATKVKIVTATERARVAQAIAASGGKVV